MKFPKALTDKLNQRIESNSFRQLPNTNSNLVDFSSNDYLGLAQDQELFQQVHQFLIENQLQSNGATGSRLISGNFELYTTTENYIATFHDCQSALIFNSGYDANVGFFSAVPQRQDVILYDELCHASIRDGIQMSHAKSYKFQHNNTEDLEKKLESECKNHNTVYVVVESVYSMDGDSPNFDEITAITNKYNAYLVVDEAHALGVFGANGCGILQENHWHTKTFARIVTFGKALGCHGAAILGSQDLKNYLVNFCRSFIYTTALSPHSVATILLAYQKLNSTENHLEKLRNNILFFNQEKIRLGLKPLFVYSKSAIQSAIIPTNNKVKEVAELLTNNGFHVKAILSPTVPKGQERLRFCIHSYNTHEEITRVLEMLSTFVFC